MTAVRTPFDRGANALMRAGADLRAAGDRLATLTVDLDEPLLLGAAGFADLVDPEAADDRLAAALARLAAGGTPTAPAERPAPGPAVAQHGRAVNEGPAPAQAPPSLAAQWEREDAGPLATGRPGQDRASRQGDRTGLGGGPSVGDHAPRDQEAQRPPSELDRGPRAGPDTGPARRSGSSRLDAADLPSAPGRAAVAPPGEPRPMTDAPPRDARTTGPVRLEDGLPPAVRRALLAGDRRALDAAVARATTAGPAPDPSAGPLAGALARIDHALARIRGGASRAASPPPHRQPAPPAAPALSDVPAPGAPRAQGSETPTPSPTPAPILLGAAPSGLRRLAERAGAIPASAAPPHAEAPPPAEALSPVDLAGPAAPPRHDTAPASLDDDARFAERLADLLRREARAQGIGGRGR